MMRIYEDNDYIIYKFVELISVYQIDHDNNSISWIWDVNGYSIKEPPQYIKDTVLKEKI